MIRTNLNIKKLLNTYTYLGFAFIFLALIFIAIPTSPYIWYRLNPDAVDKDVEKIVKEVVEEENIEQPIQEEESKVPDFNPNLPEGYFVLIPSIEVNSPISDSKDYKKALLKGTWIVNDYGTPELDEIGRAHV